MVFEFFSINIKGIKIINKVYANEHVIIVQFSKFYYDQTLSVKL